jgi:cytochrome c553
LKVVAFAMISVLSFFACASSENGTADSKTDSKTPSPLMRPGENCLRCHGPNREAASKPWSAGGTVYATKDAPVDQGLAGVTVTLSDSNGKTVKLTTNAAGNFYTPEPLVPPLGITLEKEGKVRKMPRSAPAGSCAACHSYPDATGDGISVAEGRVYLN